MKPVLKAPGTQRLKLKYDKRLSNVAFNFNLRLYMTGELLSVTKAGREFTPVDNDKPGDQW